MCLEKLFSDIVQEVGADLVIVKESKFDLFVQSICSIILFVCSS